MPDYTDIENCFIELDKICKEKNWNDKVIIKTLRKWFLAICALYKPDADIIDHKSFNEYIKNSLEKLRQTESLKILTLEEILNNPNSILHSSIKEIPSNEKCLTNRISKRDGRFILDENGEYYLAAVGKCHDHKKIELLDESYKEENLHHELQHINQNYFHYPSEFPFAYDMILMLTEGEAEYHVYLDDKVPPFAIDTENKYFIYYIVYTLLMLVIPKEMRDSWHKTDKHINSSFFSNIFKYISYSETSRNQFSDIFALITIIVATCNPDNTKEIFDNSVNKSLNRCSEEVYDWNEHIQSTIERDRKYTLSHLQQSMDTLKKYQELLQNPDLLQQNYLEFVNEEKEYIASEPKEDQEELLLELELITFEKYKSELKEAIENENEEIRKYQTARDKTPEEILEDKDYQKYQYYQFGVELNKKMQLLLSQRLTFTELFEQLLEKVTNCLIDNKDSRLEEKLNFIDEIKKNNLNNPKKI